MTEQEIFDRVARHLLTQKMHSMMDDTCVYLAPDGLKCAIGCLIPFEMYTPDLEGLSVSDGPVIYVMQNLGISCIAFLLDLQRVHDDHSIDYWATELRRVAFNYNLSYAVVDELS